MFSGRPQASDGKSGAVYSEGFVLLAHHPNDFPVESAPTTYLELSKETFVDIQPIHSSCSEQVLGLPFAQRKCIIPSDLKVKSYRQPACMLGCLRDEIHKRCHCHPFNLPVNSNETKHYPECKAKDVMCFTENYCEFGIRKIKLYLKLFKLQLNSRPSNVIIAFHRVRTFFTRQTHFQCHLRDIKIQSTRFSKKT